MLTSGSIKLAVKVGKLHTIGPINKVSYAVNTNFVNNPKEQSLPSQKIEIDSLKMFDFEKLGHSFQSRRDKIFKQFHCFRWKNLKNLFNPFGIVAVKFEKY